MPLSPGVPCRMATSWGHPAVCAEFRRGREARCQVGLSDESEVRVRQFGGAYLVPRLRATRVRYGYLNIEKRNAGQGIRWNRARGPNPEGLVTP